MEFIALLDMINRRWWVIALPAIVVFVLSLPALINAFDVDPSYSVGMRFTAAAPSDVAIDDLATYEDSVYVPWLASEYVVINLPQWITSDSFAREVSTLLAEDGIDIPYEDVRSTLVADSSRSILVMYVT